MPAIIPNNIQKETYVWDEGYARPGEAERVCIFVCSCIESVADRLGCKVKEVYERMDAVGLIKEYLIPCYDTLHTESRENVTADVMETLKLWEEKKGTGV